MHPRAELAFEAFLEKYPNAIFPKDSVKTRPLRRGIFTRLTAQNPEFSRKTIARFLEAYTQKDRYLRAIITCPDRVDLDGSAYEPILPYHREHAFKILSERQQFRLRQEAA